ncbi:hypothetical protein Bca52824_016289 [Brassica carinata]|uniref:Uncharacterized protein n=1 Tax=Brassica carinata TaxID=52824 RepID=A0A8X7W3Q3_BRACI|nr:hypothetical protein Bca52824_016289 [Brassica carinata]
MATEGSQLSKPLSPLKNDSSPDGVENRSKEASLVVKFLLMESIKKLRTVAGLLVFRARLGVFNSNEVKNEDGSFFTFSERYLQPVKSLAEHVPVTLQVSELPE